MDTNMLCEKEESIMGLLHESKTILDMLLYGATRIIGVFHPV
jgi:hypothetical protein